MILVRWDDRLVHGQVLYRWLSGRKISKIIVFDNETANDSQKKSIIRMSISREYDLLFFSVNEIESLQKNVKDSLVLISNPWAARILFDCKILRDTLNIGHTSAGIGKRKLTNGVYLKEEAIEILQYLAEEKIQIIHQVIPDETPCVLNKLLLGEKEE